MLIVLIFAALILASTKIAQNEIETRAKNAEACKNKRLLLSIEIELARVEKLLKKADKHALDFNKMASILTEKLICLRNQVNHGVITYRFLKRDLDILQFSINDQESLLNELVAKASIKSSSNFFICDYAKVLHAY